MWTVVAVAVWGGVVLERSVSVAAAARAAEAPPAGPSQPRVRLRPVPPATPTPPPSPTPTPTPRATVNLAFVTPPEWPGCVVCNFRWINPPAYEFLSILHPTHVVWAVTNGGPSSVFGPIDFALLLDGKRFLTARYDNPTALLPGAALGLHLEVRVTALGRHTLSVDIDPDGRIAETDESDNLCAFVGVWTAESISGLPQPTRDGVAAGPLLVVDLGRR